VHTTKVEQEIKLQPKEESEEDYTPYKVNSQSSHLNEENLRLLDHVHGSRTWEEHSTKEAVKMQTWLHSSVLAHPAHSPDAPPIRKGREYAACPTEGSNNVPGPSKKLRAPRSESSFSSNAVTSRQDEEERAHEFESFHRTSQQVPPQHVHHHTVDRSSQAVDNKVGRAAPHQIKSEVMSGGDASTVRNKKSKKAMKRQEADNMTNMVAALMQMAQALTEGKTATNTAHQVKPSVDKFKIFFHLTLKKVVLSKGERVTPQYVIGVFNAARDIDTAALKASNRQPINQDEWNSFFKFHLTHMTGALHEDLVALVHQGKFKDSKTFWTAVYHRLFPAYLAREALNKTLASYMVWDEPLGIERWEAITKSILDYQGAMSGKVGESHAFYMAESFNTQIHRVIDNSTEGCSAVLCREFAPYNLQIEEAMEENTLLTEELYAKANKGFIRHLTKWLNKYTYQLTFGHPQAAIRKGTPPANPPTTSPTINHMHTPTQESNPTTPRASEPPTYSQVTTEGGVGAPATPAQHIPGADKVLKFNTGYVPRLEKIAPTGELRTWHWKQLTNPPGGPRISCASKPPEECTNQACQYYGDWLDVQKLCTYCLSKEHQKADCPRHQAAVASWNAKNPKPENYRAPAQ